MKDLTDKMIESSLTTSAIVAVTISLLLIIIVVVMLLIDHFRIKSQYKKAEEEGYILVRKHSITVLKAISVFLGFIGVIFMGFGTGNFMTLNNYKVETEAIVEKTEKVVKRSKGGSTHTYYFEMEDSGKKKVSKSRYKKFDEGDYIIMVMNGRGEIQLIYDASEYMYVGKH